MAYDHGRFVWYELVTKKVDEAKRFYGEVLGWKIEPMEMNGGSYDLIKVGDQGVGGFMTDAPAGVPAHWASYLSVEDVDATAKQIAVAGGKARMDAFDVPGVGRIQPVEDAQGGGVMLFHSAEGDPPAAEGAGSWHWTELWADDADAAVEFYTKAFGFSHDQMDMPDGAYHLLKNGDAMRGGVMTKPEKKIPTMWLPYVRVEDVDQTLERAKKNGGGVKSEPIDVQGIGRIAILEDNVGAVLGIITPAS